MCVGHTLGQDTHVGLGHLLWGLPPGPSLSNGPCTFQCSSLNSFPSNISPFLFSLNKDDSTNLATLDSKKYRFNHVVSIPVCMWFNHVVLCEHACVHVAGVYRNFRFHSLDTIHLFLFLRQVCLIFEPARLAGEHPMSPGSSCPCLYITKHSFCIGVQSLCLQSQHFTH